MITISDNDRTITVTVPLRIRKRGGRKLITAPAATSAARPATPDDALLRSMIRRLEEEVDFLPARGAVPVPNGSMVPDPELAAEIAVRVRGLIRNEHEGSRHLRHLARQEPTLYRGLYPLLLETIARDSEKHATILRYLLHRVEAPSSR